MKTIRSYGNIAEAGFAQSLLQAAGIDASLVDQNAAAIGLDVRLQAPEEEVERALEILDGQAGLNSQPPGVSLDESAPVKYEVEPPAAKESGNLNVTCPNCGTEWELTPCEAERTEFSCQECKTTFPVNPDLKRNNPRTLRVMIVIGLIAVILLAAGIAVSIFAELFPRDPYVYYNRGFSKGRNGDLVGAMAEFNHAISLEPQYAAAYCARGVVKWEKGDPEGAMADYDQAIVFDPKEPRAYYDRAIGKRYKGDLSGAIADCSQAIALDRNKPEYYRKRGIIEQEQGDLDRAMDDYNQAIALDPLLAEPFYYRSSVKLAEGDFDGAMADANQAIVFDPLKSEPYVFRGDVKRAEGDYDGAMADYNQAISIDPKAPFTYLERGCLKGVMGDLEGAMADQNRAIALDAKYSAYDGRGNTYALMRKWSAALADYRQYCDLSPAGQDYPRLRIYLIRARLGEREAARKELSAYFGSHKRPVSDSGNWAAAIAGYLLGSVTETDFFAAAGSPNERKAKGQTCEAWYYAGMGKLLDGDQKAAAAYLRKCIATNEKYVEYELAQSEVKALGK